MSSLRQKLNNEWIICDGATGSYLVDYGLKAGETPESWVLTHRDILLEMAMKYYEAGSDIVTTTTFGANRFKISDKELLQKVISESISIVKEAREKSYKGRELFVSFDIGSLGRLLKPMGDLSFDEAVDAFKEIVEIALREGVDLFQIETMNDIYEAKACIIAIKELCDLPIFATTTFDEYGKLLTGGDISTAATVLESLGVDALGVNCGLGPDKLIDFIDTIINVSSIPIIIQPNAGLPKTSDGKTIYDMDVISFKSYMRTLMEKGVQVVGGCCGTTPEYIKALRELASEITFKPSSSREHTIITSYSHSLIIGDKPLAIGERINPTGKKRFKDALLKHDIDYILEEGVLQENSGADILDVNVGIPDINEKEMIEDVILALQGVTDLPLQIDTSDFDAMERAMRLYNGKPLINSVNGKEEIMNKVFPLVKKYGGVVVCLLLDENGIPETSIERIRIAERIIEVAKSYGINKNDLVFDGLCMTVSASPEAANVTLETIRILKEEMNLHTILGCSNVSFGLPAREIVNSTFLTMALSNHLSLAIINVNNAEIMKAWRSYMALSNFDPNCEEFISSYSDYVSGTSVKVAKKATIESSELSLRDSIKKGMVSLASSLASEELKIRSSLEVINEDLVPALDEVGKLFEKGKLFLPQLLLSADAAKAAFAICNEKMSSEDKTVKGRVILATVKGDVHDIGKNIVKVLLENYGYEVLDLGKDVPPERVVSVALKENIKLVGLSALMTTTVTYMEETIKQLREADASIKIVVGGAVLTKEYAEQIGADKYASDAMETVRYADEVFS